MAEKRRLGLSFSMTSSLQRQVWEQLSAVPAGQRTNTVCRAISRMYGQDSLLEAIRAVIREELRGIELAPKKEEPEQPQAGDVGDDVLGFLFALQNDGVKNNLIRYFDMFAGIGGFRAGLTRAGGFQCVGHCEIDKYADASYRAIHNIGKEEKYYPDATKIDPNDLPHFDLLCGGFPCQSWSAAGHRLGFADPRGALFFEIARLAEARKPAYLLLENVPRILQHDQGRAFATILSTLHELGYGLEWNVCNSADHGTPQARRRVYTVGYLDSRCSGQIFPLAGANGKALVQVLGGPQGSRVYDPAGVACTQTAGAGGMGGKTGLYLVGFNRKDGIVGERDTALALNASDFRGINRNQTQNSERD